MRFRASLLGLLGPAVASNKRNLRRSIQDPIPAPDTISLEIASVAKDYYDRPAVHMTQGTDEDGNNYDLDLPRGTGIIESGATIKVLPQSLSISSQGKNGRIKVKQIIDRRGPPGNDGRGNGLFKRELEYGPNRRLEAGYYGERTALVMIVRFTEVGGGTRSGGVMADPAVRANYARTVNGTVFGVYDHAAGGLRTQAGVWEECSYGQMTLGYDVDGAAPAGHFADDNGGDASDIFYVDVPIRCSTDSASADYHPYCTYTYNTATSCGNSEFYGWPEYGRNYLEANVPGFTWTAWQHKVIVFEKDSGVNCGFVGLGQTGCSSNQCYSWIPSTYADDLQDYTRKFDNGITLISASLSCHAQQLLTTFSFCTSQHYLVK